MLLILLFLTYAQFITPETADGITEMLGSGVPVLFLDALPDGLTNGEALPEAVKAAEIVTLDRLWERLREKHTVALMPASSRVRAMLCKGEDPVLYLYNEGERDYHGIVSNPFGERVCAYDPWKNRLVELMETDNGIHVDIPVDQSLFIIPRRGRDAEKQMVFAGQAKTLLYFTESICRSIDYPEFKNAREIKRPESYHLTDPKFSGFIRYEKEILAGDCFTGLEIADAHEGVEVFVNGKSAGIQITPPFQYDLTALCHPGTNKLTVEVATTLERERKGKSEAPTGITGGITLYTY